MPTPLALAAWPLTALYPSLQAHALAAFCRQLPLHAWLRRLHERIDRALRCPSAAAGWNEAVVPLPPLRRSWLRPSPASLDHEITSITSSITDRLTNIRWNAASSSLSRCHFSLLFLFQRFVMPPPAPVPTVPPATANQPGTERNAGTSARTRHPAPRRTWHPAPAHPLHRQAPAIAATVSEANAREIVVETTQAQGRVLEPGREDRSLDPEGIPHRRGTAARSGARRRRRECDQAVHPDCRRSGDRARA